MDTMISVWTMVEHMRVASGAAELAIFTAILYWFFTSSRVADMLEVVGERVGGWCGRDTSSSLRQAVRARKRHHNDIYSKLDADMTSRQRSLYKIKERPSLPPPQPQMRPPIGLACARCAPLSRESWQDPNAKDTGSVINILNIGQQNFANGGVVSRYLCDIAQCCNLLYYEYKDIVPSVVKDDSVQQSIELATQEKIRQAMESGASGDNLEYATVRRNIEARARKVIQDISSAMSNNVLKFPLELATQEKIRQAMESGASGDNVEYATVRRNIEARARKVIQDISSAMSNNVLKFVAWVCHKTIRRVASGGCATRVASIDRLRRANAAGLPLVFVPLHRSHFDYMLVTFTLYLTGLRPPLVAAGDNMRIPFFGWFLRGCGAFYIRRSVEGSDRQSDPVYKSALRAYILNSLSARNNLEFFIEGGRTRTGKPQTPKAGILSVIMDAYLDGKIDDALLVPVTLNYDKLVDGNFVREQLGMAKQMETFWSALRGIWRTLNTDHGSIRVDLNQPISLKELVTSFQKYNHYKAPIETPLSPPNNNLAVNLDRQILYNHSHSSLYGADVSTEHKMMVEAIGRHVVYDAAVATALMCTNVVSYVLLTEMRRGATLAQLASAVEARGNVLKAEGRDLGYTGDAQLVLKSAMRRGATLAQLASAVEARGNVLKAEGRDLGYTGDAQLVLKSALDTLGKGLVRREGREGRGGRALTIRPTASIAASLELSYYANTVVAHYAAPAILATALESIITSSSEPVKEVSQAQLISSSLALCEVLSHEFILCSPCVRIEERMLEAIDSLVCTEVLAAVKVNPGLEEEQWSRRFAKRLEEMDECTERPDPALRIKFVVLDTPQAIAERRRLLLTIRPLLEAYAATCRHLQGGSMKTFVKTTLDSLTDNYVRNKMPYGEAVSTDAIRNCLRLLRQWGVVDMYSENRERKLKICDAYQTKQTLDDVCHHICKFNMDTPLLSK